MSDSLLPALEINAEQSARLPSKPFGQLLRFLLRWEDYAGALACLDAQGPGPLVSVYDLRAEALAGAGRYDEAIAIMNARLDLRESPAAWLKLADIHLRAGDAAGALQIVERLAVEDDPPQSLWNVMGKTHLMLADLDRAEASYLRMQKLSPGNRASLAGLAQVHLRRGQPVSGAAYAVRAFAGTDEQGYGPAVPLLRKLRDFFAETGDTNHLADANAQLAERLEAEVAGMRELLAGLVSRPGAPVEGLATGGMAPVGTAPPGRTEPASEGPAVDTGGEATLAPLPGDLATIPVSPDEQAELLAAAAKHFGFSSLLTGQAEIMACVRRGEDVLAVLPTGGGKSLCYQLPALMDDTPGITLVISPLIALMKDQVDNLPGPVRNSAVAINSSLDGPELRRAISALRSGRYRLVYAAPERLRQLPFLHALREAGVARLVIDEAHCVSIWGHDFRPDYLGIARLAHDLGDPPTLALTATAPPLVRADVQQRLFGGWGERETGRRGDAGTRGRGEMETRGRGDPETRRQGDSENGSRSAASTSNANATLPSRSDAPVHLGPATPARSNSLTPPLSGSPTPPSSDSPTPPPSGSPTPLLSGSPHLPISASPGLRVSASRTPPRLIATDTYRPNLLLSAVHVRDDDEKLGQLLELCGRLEGSGIVYAPTRRRCEELAELLARRGLAASFYHAGLEARPRAAAQEAFMAGETRIIVATVAFGMGIDKADIRFIIHFGLPASLEGYYQEAGRAGRDGLPAHCVLLYGNSDRSTLSRHAREDVIAVDYLRKVYAAASRGLRRRSPGILPVVELLAEAGGEETQLRVALSVLEQAGLLHRDYDAPSAVTLRWTGCEAADPLLARLRQAVRVPTGQQVNRDFLDLAAACDLPPPELEMRLLYWQSAGCLDYQPAARELLLSLPPAPMDASVRIDSLLGQYAAIQQQRVEEIWAYAITRRCRHGHLANYLGGRPRASCRACDNCIDVGLAPREAAGTGTLPSLAEQLAAILAALAERGAGRRNLVLRLRGDREAPDAGRASAGFGALAFRSETALNKLIDALLDHGYIGERRLDHGGVALGLTPAGRRALAGEAPLDGLVEDRPPPPARWEEAARGYGQRGIGGPGPAAAGGSGRMRRPLSDHLIDRPGRTAAKAFDPDNPAASALFERLRAWRLAEARQRHVAPFIIFGDAVLRAIAAARPHTEAELLAVKGVGKAKLAEYGLGVLGVVAEAGNEAG